MDGPTFRTGFLSLLLPSGIPDEQTLAFIRRRVTDALAATGEWAARIDVVGQAIRPGELMRRWFVEYETGLPGPCAEPVATHDASGEEESDPQLRASA